ncbi:hypothetical protein GCM10011309_14580 [Litorimonas cladophorae]|uniref:Uncharacterized protein n=1 Tax=Litorimonas cladophorae TaxID=1220491 RepID=A0A918NEY3_9PROT|nr:hypothetical protein [Litorimonas cladophorae]GGX65408.1 hypothetical protein GCM10011309_14580 [Litorimonas cladophorae]
MFRRFLSKFIFAIGCFTLLGIVYIASFYVVRNELVLPFEKANFGETHALRPAYNGLYYPLRYFTANGSSFTRDIPEEYRGILKKKEIKEDDGKNYRSANIDEFEGNSVGIGFVGSPRTIKAYDQIENEVFVRLTFGRALSHEHDRFINKLTNSEVINLMDDPRIKRMEYSSPQRLAIQQAYDKLVGSKKECAKAFEQNYKEQVLEHCLQTGYARNIGGGCFHLITDFVHTAVLEQTIKNCET